jgi:hypothetical protein
MQQRLRVAVDALTRDLLLAGAGLATHTAAVLPYRIDDAETGVFYRRDAVTVRHTSWDISETITTTYYVRVDRGTGTPQLVRANNEGGTFPMVDHVVALQFEYFPADGIPIDPLELYDGPWLPSATDAMKFDADLLRIRRVRVMLRIEASLASMRGLARSLFASGGTSTAAERYLPDDEVRFDVAVRNLEDEG